MTAPRRDEQCACSFSAHTGGPGAHPGRHPLSVTGGGDFTVVDRVVDAEGNAADIHFVSSTFVSGRARPGPGLACLIIVLLYGLGLGFGLGWWLG